MMGLLTMAALCAAAAAEPTFSGFARWTRSGEGGFDALERRALLRTAEQDAVARCAASGAARCAPVRSQLVQCEASTCEAAAAAEGLEDKISAITAAARFRALQAEAAALAGSVADGLGVPRPGELPPALRPIAGRIEALQALPEARGDRAGLAASVAADLRREAGMAASEADLVSRVERAFSAPSAEQGIPVARFVKLSAVRRFLYRHRLRRPKSYAKLSPEELMAGRVNVEVGVEMTGVVQGAHRAKEDKDWCFFIGPIEVEITPEWSLSHPRLHLPKDGETVRVRGWTFYDSFHEEDVPGERATLWEVHPAQEVEVLAPAP